MTMNEIRIPITVGGITFKNPFYVASGPTAKTVRQLEAIERAGWSAASIKLSIDPAPYINQEPRYAFFEDRRALGFVTEKRLTFGEGLDLVRAAKTRLTELLLFANITYAGDEGIDGWINMCIEFEKAGADVIELNMCCPNMSFNVSLTSAGTEQTSLQTGASLGQQEDEVAKIVRSIKGRTAIPLFVKLTPEGGRIAQVAKAALDAGADAVGGTANRMCMPPIDIDEPEKSTYHLQEGLGMSCYAGPWLKPLAQRDTYEMRKLCGADAVIAATGGITDWRDAVEMILCGGDLIGVCSETLYSGYDIVRPMVKGVYEYMHKHGYTSISDFRDLVVSSMKPAPDIALFSGHAKITDPLLSGPCKAACPHHVPAAAYIGAAARGDFRAAYDIISEKGPLQHVCAYICPAICEDACVRGAYGRPVRIRELKRYILDKGQSGGWASALSSGREPNGHSVAVIGAGVTGISAAAELAAAGYAVDLLEKKPAIGGRSLTHDAAHLLPDNVIFGLNTSLAAIGVNVKVCVELGNDISIEDLLKQGYSAVLIAHPVSDTERKEFAKPNVFFAPFNTHSEASVIHAAAAGTRAAAGVDAGIRGDAAIVKINKKLTVSRREAVLQRVGILPYEAPVQDSPISSDEEAITEAARCLNCGCGEGCQLCKKICTEFAPMVTARDELRIEAKACVACGMCFSRCPQKNIEMVNTGRKL